MYERRRNRQVASEHNLISKTNKQTKTLIRKRKTSNNQNHSHKRYCTYYKWQITQSKSILEGNRKQQNTNREILIKQNNYAKHPTLTITTIAEQKSSALTPTHTTRSPSPPPSSRKESIELQLLKH